MTDHRIAVLVPYRPDGGWRDRTWSFIREQMTGVTVIEGHDLLTDRPFSMGRAFNNAQQQAVDADYLALWNADVLWDANAVAQAVALIAEGTPYVIPFNDMIRLTRDATEQQLVGVRAMDFEIRAQCCNGLTVVAAGAWQPWDERFEGWGPDDMAWRSKMARVYGAAPTLSLPCIHLWHPDRQHDPGRVEIDAQAASYALYNTEYA